MPLNPRLLKIAVSKDPKAKKVLVKAVRPAIKELFEERKDQFFEEFDNDEVSQEIDGGYDAPTSQPELAKLKYGGNLFSLLGFYQEQKPIQELRQYLYDNIVLYKTSAGKTGSTAGTIRFDTTVIAPSISEINHVMASDEGSKLEWTSRSWTELLARGVSGLPKYLFDLTRDFSSVPSRSGPAIQVKNDLREAASNLPGIPYVARLMDVLTKIIDK